MKHFSNDQSIEETWTMAIHKRRCLGICIFPKEMVVHMDSGCGTFSKDDHPSWPVQQWSLNHFLHINFNISHRRINEQHQIGLCHQMFTWVIKRCIKLMWKASIYFLIRFSWNIIKYRFLFLHFGVTRGDTQDFFLALTQESLLTMLRRPDGIPEFKPGSTVYKANALPLGPPK